MRETYSKRRKGTEMSMCGREGGGGERQTVGGQGHNILRRTWINSEERRGMNSERKRGTDSKMRRGKYGWRRGKLKRRRGK